MTEPFSYEDTSVQSLDGPGTSIGDLSDQRKRAILAIVDRMVDPTMQGYTLLQSLEAQWQSSHRTGHSSFVERYGGLAEKMVRLANAYDDLRSKLPGYNELKTLAKTTDDVEVGVLFGAVFNRFKQATAIFRSLQREASMAPDLDDGATIVQGNQGTQVEDLHDRLKTEAEWLRAYADRRPKIDSSDGQPE